MSSPELGTIGGGSGQATYKLSYGFLLMKEKDSNSHLPAGQ